MRHRPFRARFALMAVACLIAACDRRPPECRTPEVTQIATIDRLIAETKGNLDRGFTRGGTVAAQPRVSTNLCLGSGSGNLGMSFCSGNGGGGTVRSSPEPIDPATERAKLASLEASRARILSARPNATALCTIALAGR